LWLSVLKFVKIREFYLKKNKIRKKIRLAILLGLWAGRWKCRTEKCTTGK